MGIRCSLLTGWYIRCPYAEVLSFPSRFVIPAKAGIQSLPRRMGPRIREDDKILSPSFPPEYFFSIPLSISFQCEGRSEGCFRRRRESILSSCRMYHLCLLSSVSQREPTHHERVDDGIDALLVLFDEVELDKRLKRFLDAA